MAALLMQSLTASRKLHTFNVASSLAVTKTGSVENEWTLSGKLVGIVQPYCSTLELRWNVPELV